jgi:hypothetical protein
MTVDRNPMRKGGLMAIREEVSVVIERPVEEVFAFATDPEKDEES